MERPHLKSARIAETVCLLSYIICLIFSRSILPCVFVTEPCRFFSAPHSLVWFPLFGIFSEHFSCAWDSPGLLIVSCFCLCLPTFNLRSPSISISGFVPFLLFSPILSTPPPPSPAATLQRLQQTKIPPAFQREYFFRPSNPQILIEAQNFQNLPRFFKILKNSQ